MADSDRVVSVEICGQRYPIRSTLDAEYVARLAGYVDEKIRAAGEATSSGDGQRLAVLAALNIADEYHLVKKNQSTGTTDYRKRTHQLVNALDEILQDDRRAG